MKSYDKKVLDLSMEAGRILLDAGAEIFRVEETIERISRAFGIEKCSPFVMSTGIFLTGGGCESAFQRNCGRKVYLRRGGRTSGDY